MKQTLLFLMLFHLEMYASDMMQQVQEMRDCIEKIDMQKVEQLEEETEKDIEKIRVLCANNQRAKAQNIVLSFKEKYTTNAEIKQFEKCIKLMQNALPGMIPEIPYQELYEETEGKHVCDALE